MRPVQAIRITIAACMLGVGPKLLMRELRARNILDASNKPAPEYVEAGQLSAEWIPIPMGRTGITRHHLTPTVTIKGWPMLELIARDIRHGAKEVAAPVRGGIAAMPTASARRKAISDVPESWQSLVKTHIQIAFELRKAREKKQ